MDTTELGIPGDVDDDLSTDFFRRCARRSDRGQPFCNGFLGSANRV
ncbi:hypothetical protein RB2083_676 [Rhodobacteraceae bacterium HTCC2083]|nr:hypothetical protein RB2083_676 [Rhodobacteraceae bacterium HTCC2083]